ncbi:MAG: glycosyltransferase family 2 protein [Gammaproteobacteria bacterium]
MSVDTRQHDRASGCASAAPRLSVCVIGRNEAPNLPALFASLEPLRARVPQLEVVFVDSASTDASVALARAACDVVVHMPVSPRSCAALNRHWGTRTCSGEFILYLDGDMQLEPAFVAALATLVEQGTPDGLVGDYTDVFPDGGTREKALGRRLRPGTASHFGGAVVLRRTAVITAGNWDAGLFAWEENELYTRLRAQGCRVDYVARPMVRHATPRIGRLGRLWGCVSPAAPGVGAKFYGFGQALAARRRAGTLVQFVRGFPEPFSVWAALALALAVLAMGRPWLAFGVLALAAAFVTWRRGPALFVVYALLPLQALAGYRRYDGAILEPAVVERVTRAGGSTSEAH